MLTKYNEEIIYEECQIKNRKINDNTNGLKIAKKIIEKISTINLQIDVSENKSEEKNNILKNIEFKFGEKNTNEKLLNFIKNAVEHINYSCIKKLNSIFLMKRIYLHFKIVNQMEIIDNWILILNKINSY